MAYVKNVANKNFLLYDENEYQHHYRREICSYTIFLIRSGII